ALALNVFLAGLDVAGLIMPQTALSGDDIRAIVIAGIPDAIRQFGEPDVMQGQVDGIDVLQFIVRAANGMLTKSAEVASKKTAKSESVKKLSGFIGRGLESVSVALSVGSAISKTGKVATRVYDLLRATPIETTYIIPNATRDSLVAAKKTQEQQEDTTAQQQITTPTTNPPLTSEKLVRVFGDIWVHNNEEGTPPLGVIIGVADTDTSPKAWRSDSDNPDLRRGDRAKYLSERTRIGDPLEKFPQSTRAIEVELPSGKRGWIVAEWSYKGNPIVLAEIISPDDSTKLTIPEPIFADMEGKWNGTWVDGKTANQFEISFRKGWWLYGQGSETIENGTESFTMGGSLFGNKIFFYKYYPDRTIYYEGDVSGDTAGGTWQENSWFGSSGTWTMTRAN
ncbi:MAG: hypothetical protein V1905_03520, partial [bacterium]